MKWYPRVYRGEDVHLGSAIDLYENIQTREAVRRTMGHGCSTEGVVRGGIGRVWIAGVVGGVTGVQAVRDVVVGVRAGLCHGGLVETASLRAG